MCIVVSQILARVIATVVQFSQQQMMDILHRADSRSVSDILCH